MSITITVSGFEAKYKNVIFTDQRLKWYFKIQSAQLNRETLTGLSFTDAAVPHSLGTLIDWKPQSIGA